MFRILIVDDEKLERRGIQFLLEHRREDFKIAEASNGREACQILDKSPVDILITDVKMPFMDGIELAEYARKARPNIEIMIFSGYGEFEFARQAMRFGVTSYVLKPVDPAEFDRIFEEVKIRLSRRREQELLLQKSQNDQEKYYLGKYLYHGSEELLRQIQQRISVDGWADFKVMLLIESEDSFFDTSEEKFMEKISHVTDQELEFLNLGQNQELCILKSKCDQRILAEKIFEEASRQFDTNFYIAVSDRIKDIKNLPKVFQDLDTRMERRFYQKQQRIFYAVEETKTDTAEQQLKTVIDQMLEDIRLEDICHLRKHFEVLLGKTDEMTHYSQIYMKFIFSNLIKEFYTHQYQDGEKLEQAIQRLYEYKSIQAVFQMVNDLITELENNIEKKNRNIRNEVARAKSYVYAHYREDISVEMLAEKVYLSPGYFSYIFKKETGENLNRFIRRYRIEKAKELLETTDMKIVQICRETGFSNVSYFCKNFREYCGLTPEQFRRGENGDE